MMIEKELNFSLVQTHEDDDYLSDLYLGLRSAMNGIEKEQYQGVLDNELKYFLPLTIPQSGRENCLYPYLAGLCYHKLGAHTDAFNSFTRALCEDHAGFAFNFSFRDLTKEEKSILYNARGVTIYKLFENEEYQYGPLYMEKENRRISHIDFETNDRHSKISGAGLKELAILDFEAAMKLFDDPIYTENRELMDRVRFNDDHSCSLVSRDSTDIVKFSHNPYSITYEQPSILFFKNETESTGNKAVEATEDENLLREGEASTCNCTLF